MSKQASAGGSASAAVPISFATTNCFAAADAVGLSDIGIVEFKIDTRQANL
jgi:hypothetical protein